MTDRPNAEDYRNGLERAEAECKELRDGWKPIDTAPIWKEIIVFYGGKPCRLSQPNCVATAVLDESGRWVLGSMPGNRKPTHWLPLPAAPNTTTNGS